MVKQIKDQFWNEINKGFLDIYKLIQSDIFKAEVPK